MVWWQGLKRLKVKRLSLDDSSGFKETEGD
jgi:hypothetical protein